MGNLSVAAEDLGPSDVLELVSFKVCPFVQGCVILLQRQKREFKMTSIDLANKPEWFLKISPTGKVPLLTLPDGAVVWESRVILEYLDQTAPHGEQIGLWDEPHKRATLSGWWVHMTSMLPALMKLKQAKVKGDDALYDQACEVLEACIKTLEKADAIKGRFFLGDGQPSLLDCAMAPMFLRVKLYEAQLGKASFSREKHPEFARWFDHLVDGVPETYASLGVTLGLDSGASREDIEAEFNRIVFE